MVEHECLIIDGPHAGVVVDVQPGVRVIDMPLPSSPPRFRASDMAPPPLETAQFQRYAVHVISISKATEFADPVLVGLPEGSRANPSVAAFEYAMRVCFDLGRQRGRGVPMPRHQI